VNSAKSAKKKWPICEQACLHEQLGKYAKLFANVISIIAGGIFSPRFLLKKMLFQLFIQR